MLERDRARFAFAAAQAAPSPLGAGALAGSTLPLPPPPNAMRNSIDAVADRDFALDYLYAAAVLFTHLSRIGEELVLWTTERVRLRAAPRGQRDRLVDHAAEAEPRRRRARARQGRHGDRPAHRACSRRSSRCRSRTTATCRRTSRRCSPHAATSPARSARSRCWSAGSTFDHGRLAAATADPLLRATDAAEALVREGVPFRDAHEQVAAEVRAGTFEAPPAGDRLGDVAAAVAAARERWS